MSAEEKILTKKTGVLFLNMGGPDKVESVRPFLYNLFSDPDIIKLPLSFLFQKPLAKFIVSSRGKAAEENYKLMGGGSPQLPLTIEQVDNVKNWLSTQGVDIPAYIAMRYWHPFTDEALDKIATDKIEHLVIVSLYPHFSYTTTGSSINELRRRLKARGMKNITLSVVSGYHQDPQYLNSLTECIQQGLDEYEWQCPKEEVHILFSAHSLPLSHIKRTKDPYPEHIFNCAKTVTEKAFPKNPWDLCYQSKVGKMPWLGPYTESALQFLSAKKVDNILMVPISFVTDHIETLVEIDMEYTDLAKKELGIQFIHRAPVMNSRSSFIKTLGTLIIDKLERRHILNSKKEELTVG